MPRHPDYDGICMTLPSGEEFHVGYSRLSKFFQCPKSFKYSYIDKIRMPAGLPLRRGQAYHGVVEELLKHKMEHGELYDRDRADKLAIREAKKNDLSDAEIYKVIDATRFYWDHQYPKHRPLAVEKDFSIVRGGVTITGRIDLIEKRCRKKKKFFDVTDHKFSYDTWADARAKYGCQPVIYQWAAIDQFEEELGLPYGGFAYNIIRLFPHPIIQKIRIKRLSQDMSDWWEEQIFEAARIIRRGYFPAIPSDKVCGFCDHKNLCKPAIYRLEKSLIGEPDADGDEDM